ncbi:hypothetical protein DEDE109153_04430 [Deinococcus deserti]
MSLSVVAPLVTAFLQTNMMFFGHSFLLLW